MARVLLVGNATLDIINSVQTYPTEDAELRASAQVVRRGGNASNTAVVLSQLGLKCHWAGTLADDVSSEVIRKELIDAGVSMDAVQQVVGGRTPTSYVLLSQANGSRTIVHFRDLSEFGFAVFQQIKLREFDWLHFEGRNVEETCAMLDHARQQAPEVPRSVEIEKPRDDIESLCEAANLLLYSRSYAQACGAMHDPVSFLLTQQRHWPEAEHICSWAEQGAWGVGQQSEVMHSPAMNVSQVIDTLGAGDTFNAAIIHAKLAGLGLADCLRDACQLAGQKCAQQGLHGLR